MTASMTATTSTRDEIDVLVEVRARLRQLRRELLNLPIVSEIERLNAEHAVLVSSPVLKERFGQMLVDALAPVGTVTLHDISGHVHARVDLVGDYEFGHIDEKSTGVMRVVDMIEATVPEELLGIIFVEIRNRSGWGPFATVDYYAGRSTEQTALPISL